MFKIDGFSLPSDIKVEGPPKKKNGNNKKKQSEKLSSTDLQALYDELAVDNSGPKNKNHSRSAKEPVRSAKEPAAPSVKTPAGKTVAPRASSQAQGSSDNTREASTSSTKAPKQAQARSDMQQTHKNSAPRAPPAHVKPAKTENLRAEKSKERSKAEKIKPQSTKAKAEGSNDNGLKRQHESAVPVSAPPSKKLTPLQMKMQQKLSGARFRWINEQLYTTNSNNAVEIFKQQPEVFKEYHDGFRHQVESWPENPVLSFVQQFRDRLAKPLNAPGGLIGDKATGEVVVADMGCGEAQLSLELSRVKHRKAKFVTHSFDLHKANDRITVSDIANVPLPDESSHVVVFSLALMGTNLVDFVREGIRILKPGGIMWIAEIKSRFDENNYEEFVETLKNMGLYHKMTDDTNKMFVKFEFVKLPHKMARARKDLQPLIQLKPCIYKRR